LQSGFDAAKMKTSTRQQQKATLRLFESDPQPRLVGESAESRLVELVRLLARRAARQVFEEQMKGRCPPRS
jgi:hypothetical protein